MLVSWVFIITLLGIYVDRYPMATIGSGAVLSESTPESTSSGGSEERTAKQGTVPTAVSIFSHPSHKSSHKSSYKVTMQKRVDFSMSTTVAVVERSSQSRKPSPDTEDYEANTKNPCKFSTALQGETENIWYVSEDGSDDNDCHTAATQCRNLQTVLDRATDGADIYVTSPILPLDAVTFRTRCFISNNKSYTVSSVDQNIFNITCKYNAVYWFVTDGDIVEVKHAWFPIYVNIYTHGVLSLEACTFSAGAYIGMRKGQYENEPYYNDLESFHSYTSFYQIRITKSHIESSSQEGFTIHQENGVRAIHIEQCNIAKSDVGVISGVDGEDITLSRFVLKDSAVSDSAMDVFSNSANSFMSLRFQNVSLFNTRVRCFGRQYQFGVDLAKCTFTGQQWHLDPTFNHLIQFSYVYCIRITGCQFNLHDSDQETVLYIRNTHYIDFEDPARPYIKSFFLLDQKWACEICAFAVIQNTRFIGYSGKVSGGVIESANSDLVLSDCIFTMSKSYKPNRRKNIQGFIFLEEAVIRAENITLDASNVSEVASVSMMSLRSFGLSITSIYLICPVSFKINEVVQKTNPQLSHYSCDHACDHTSYSLEQGTLTIDSDEGDKKETPRCHPCPVGATCTDSIAALPHHWGHKTQTNLIVIMRCPEAYCCEDEESCSGIDSCNKNRIGTLCGTCKSNWTESLFSSECIMVEDCKPGLIIILYILCALGYGTALLSTNIIKVKMQAFLVKIKECCKASSLCQRMVERKATKKKNTLNIQEDETKFMTEGTRSQRPEQSCSNAGKSYVKSKADPRDRNAETETSPQMESIMPARHDNVLEKESGIKYMQILFYYVQDASLFKIHMADQDSNGESIFVKVIQFSPEFMATFYSNVSALCFSHRATAVTKVLIKVLLGPTVLVFLFLIYLLQKILSKIGQQKKTLWSSLKCCLVQAFLMTILLSYQKTVTGLFSLIQCVAVGNQTVLYIQGDIECYTWWQIVIHIYMILCVVPILLVFSHCIFYVKDDTMSVKMFIMSSLLPIPFITVHFLEKCLKKINASPKMVSVFDSRFDSGKTHNHYASDVDTTQQSSDEVSNNDQCKETLLHTLLHHYRTLRFCGIRFTWLGIHKLYRVVLVACNTYITDPVTKLYTMSGALIPLMFTHIVAKPYRDNRANLTASFSYLANICIAIINISKSGLMVFDCKNNCSYKVIIIGYLEICETVLLVYIPLTAVVFFAVGTAFQKCKIKVKKRFDGRRKKV